MQQKCIGVGNTSLEDHYIPLLTLTLNFLLVKNSSINFNNLVTTPKSKSLLSGNEWALSRWSKRRRMKFTICRRVISDAVHPTTILYKSQGSC